MMSCSLAARAKTWSGTSTLERSQGGDTTLLASYCGANRLTRWSLLSKRGINQKMETVPIWQGLAMAMGWLLNYSSGKVCIQGLQSLAGLTSDTIWHGFHNLTRLANLTLGYPQPSDRVDWSRWVDDSWKTGSMRKIWIKDLWHKRWYKTLLVVIADDQAFIMIEFISKSLMYCKGKS